VAVLSQLLFFNRSGRPGMPSRAATLIHHGAQLSSTGMENSEVLMQYLLKSVMGAEAEL